MPAPTRSPIDVTSIAFHVGALVIWPFAVGYTAFRLLAARYPIRRL